MKTFHIRPLLLSAVLLIPAVLFSGCLSGPIKQSPADGTWYEQNENGGIITIKNNTISYHDEYYDAEVRYEPSNTTEGFELVPTEDWYYIDIFYNAKDDVLTMHDLPHTDGDGGYHLYTFLRTEYVAPPEPVYGERTDKSDPDAPKEFSDYTIRSLTLDVYEPWRDNGDMAPEQPSQGEYSYELSVTDDGTGTLVSSFCQEVTVSEEQLQELSGILENSSLPTLNGVDIITEEMPEDTVRYDLSVEFASGETFHSRANGKDVSPVWETDGRTLHQALFFIMVDAGYNISTGEFHSSGPMKRIISSYSDPAGYTVDTGLGRFEKNGEAYDHLVYAEYPEFTVEGDASPALIKTLNEISDDYKKKAEKDLEYDFGIMESAPEGLWKNEEHRTTYSFYAPEHEAADRTKYLFWISEGHANCFGIGKYGSGEYTYDRFCIDAETGEVLSLNDFFNDENALCDLLITLLDEHNWEDESQEYLHSEACRKKLLKGLSTPESEGGIGFDPAEDGIILYADESFDDILYFPYNFKIYYDDVQDLLNDAYASERSI